MTPITKRFVHRFPEDVIARIREKDLDVLIRFGFNILRGEILNAARYGVWSYHHGDNDEYRGGPAYFWEVYEDNLISGAILQVLTEELDAGKVLCKGFFAARRGGSWHRNQVRPFWGAGTFMIQKLQQLHQCGWQQLQSEMVPPQPYRGKTRIYTVPTNGQMLKWLGPLLVRTGARQAARRIQSRRMPHWMLGVRVGDPSRTDPPTGDLKGYQWIQSPRGHFYADPFLVEHLGKTWVSFEDFNYTTQKGVISCSEVLGAGKLSNPTVALERPYHLSYPRLVHDEGRLYMIPESLDSKTVQLYRCERFPDVWEPVKVLLEAAAVDTTVWKADGLYWFFVTLVEPRGGEVQLWIFYSPTQTGDWISHRQNPISTDARYSRGAGAILQRAGKLIRPSQDCTGEFGYGRAIFFNEIVALNCDEYIERPCGTMDARGIARMIGTHTYSRSGDLEVVDGCALPPVRNVV